jgi:peroxiredoxin Q/BCP
MTLPALGTEAPDFELQTDAGETVRLKDLRGNKVVLFFYPRADTPGCIKESCGFRDDYRQFQDREIVVLGISPDSVRAQANFSRRYGFQYPLLADAEHEVAEAYGVWNPKKLFGIDYLGVVRTTFVIDEQGRIEQVFENVTAEGHSQEVLEALAHSTTN